MSVREKSKVEGNELASLRSVVRSLAKTVAHLAATVGALSSSNPTEVIQVKSKRPEDVSKSKRPEDVSKYASCEHTWEGGYASDYCTKRTLFRRFVRLENKSSGVRYYVMREVKGVRRRVFVEYVESKAELLRQISQKQHESRHVLRVLYGDYGP